MMANASPSVPSWSQVAANLHAPSAEAAIQALETVNSDGWSEELDSLLPKVQAEDTNKSCTQVPIIEIKSAQAVKPSSKRAFEFDSKRKQPVARIVKPVRRRLLQGNLSPFSLTIDIALSSICPGARAKKQATLDDVDNQAVLEF